jgi:hypothetical protein
VAEIGEVIDRRPDGVRRAVRHLYRDGDLLQVQAMSGPMRYRAIGMCDEFGVGVDPHHAGV